MRNYGESMKTDNVIVEKSKAFALRIIKLYKYLCNEKKEYILSKQILRAVQVSVQMLKKLSEVKARLIFMPK